MSIEIIETSAEAKAKQKEYKKKTACPECGSTSNFGSYFMENRGTWFRPHEVKVTTYNCVCGCKYKVSED
jgi:C4-type Zn-finger protein